MEAGQQRAHGQTAATETAHELSKTLTDPHDYDEVAEPIDLTRGFKRMRTDWHSRDRDTVQELKGAVDLFIFNQFSDAFAIEYEIWDIVREKVFDPTTGEVKIGEDGLAEWAVDSSGRYIEDWSKMNSFYRERLLYQILTRLFNWEQKLGEIKGDAMLANAIWNEAFATGFDTAPADKKTEAARTAVGNLVGVEHRYFAVYRSMILERANNLVRSMDRMCMRLKDLHLA